MPKIDIVKISKDLQTRYAPILSENIKDLIEVVVQFVVHENLKSGSGSQIPNEHVWSAVVKINQTVKSLLNSESQKDWGKIYCFLYKKIGKDIEEKEKMEDDAITAWSDLQTKHKFVAYWSYSDYNEMPPDLKNTIFPLPIKVLVYSSEAGSGWGKNGQIELPENATYFDVWKAANDLIVKSGDLRHVFVENFLPMRAPNLQVDGMYSIITGS